MTKKNEEVAVVEQQNNVPATVGSARGMEHADMEGISFPRTKIMQPTSPELNEEGSVLRPGELINTLTKEKLPNYKFIPLIVWDSNILFTPRDDKPEEKERLKMIGFTDDDFQAGNILCKAADGKTGDRRGKCANCNLHKFVGNEKPVCNATVNVLAKFEGIDLPVIIQFAVTSKKHGDRFKQMLMFSGGDIFRKYYELFTIRKTAAGNKTWFEMSVKPAGIVEEENLGLAETMYEAFLSSMDNWTKVEETQQFDEAVSTENKEY